MKFNIRFLLMKLDFYTTGRREILNKSRNTNTIYFIHQIHTEHHCMPAVMSGLWEITVRKANSQLFFLLKRPYSRCMSFLHE